MEAAQVPSAAAVPPPEFPARPLLGELLVRAGRVSWAHVEQALDDQRTHGGRIGEILVARGHVTTKALAQALAEQHGLEFVDLARVEVQPEAASLLPEPYARRAQVLPVRYVDENLLEVAIADPTNLRTADDLRLALGLSIRLGVADASALEGTIARTYRVYIEVTHDGAEDGAAALEDVLARADDNAPTIDL